MKTFFISHPECMAHRAPSAHPECPERLDAIDDQLIASGIEPWLRHREAPLATREQLLRVHDAAYLDALEWPRLDSVMTSAEREKGIQDLIELVRAVDEILQAQSKLDAEYFVQNTQRTFQPKEVKEIMERLLKAYRWQYIYSGVEHPRFQELFGSLTTEAQRQEVKKALQALV